MVRANLTLIIWGLLVIVVDVNFDTLDVVFDPFGFAMIAVALIPLARIERSFSPAVPIAFCAIPVSFIQLLGEELWSFWSLVGTALQFSLIWFVCTGVMRLAASQGNLRLSETAAYRRKLNVIAGGVALAAVGITRVLPPIAPPLAIAAFVFAVVVLGLTLLMLHEASRELVP